MGTLYQTALITGAGSGIGQAVAQSLASMGMKVALVGRDRAKLEATRDKLGGDAAATAMVEPCDVANRDEVSAMVGRVREGFGALDVLVCNAGMNVRRRKIEELDPADWDRMIATNLTGAFNLVHAALPLMKEQGRGLVVQVCSIAGARVSTLGGTGYSASKFGQAALGLGLAREAREWGIRSSVIYPGEVNTPILDERPVPVPADRRAAILQPEDVAAAVAFLATLHPRAHVPELVLKPTVDDWS